MGGGQNELRGTNKKPYVYFRQKRYICPSYDNVRRKLRIPLLSDPISSVVN